MRAKRVAAKPPPTAGHVWEWMLLFAAAFAAYWPALHGGLLWDDSGHITRTDLQSIHGLWRIWTELGATQQYYPILHSAFWLEHRLWGDAMFGYHLANVALHATSAYLVVLILRRLAIPGALLAGAVFALHPVGVESVAWISEQKNTLSAVFYLSSALMYFDSVAQGKTVAQGFSPVQPYPWWAEHRYWFAFLLFVLAVLSKSVTATLPAALLVVLWWKRGRLSWKDDIAPLAPWFVVGAAGGVFTAWVEREVIGAKGADFSLTLLQRCLLAGRALWFYLGKLLWPGNLIFIYPHWTIDPSSARAYLFPLSALVLTAILWLIRKRTRAPLAGFLFFAGTLFPALGFFSAYPFRFSYVADHFQYLASLGIIVPLSAGIALAAARRTGAARNFARAICVALPLVLGVLTWQQSIMYGDAETLYRNTIARNPDAWIAHLNLGIDLAAIPGRMPQAIEAFESAVRIKPDYAEARRDLALAHTMFGSALSNEPGRSAEAVDHLHAALQIDPDSAVAHYTLANILNRTQKPGAIEEYEAALRADPNLFEAQYNLGTVLMDIPERHADAIAHLQAAVRMRPDNAEAHLNLGVALSDIPGRSQDAIRELEAALAKRPDLSQARELLDDLRKSKTK
jgi:tetratricopeptide (TPR) repeat protein